MIAAFALTDALIIYGSIFMATRREKSSATPIRARRWESWTSRRGIGGRRGGNHRCFPPGDNRHGDPAHRAGTPPEAAGVYIRQLFGNNLFVLLPSGRQQGRVDIDCRIKVITDNNVAKNRRDAFSSRPFELLLIDRQVIEL